MLTQFSYYLPTKIIFGQPAIEGLQDELTNLGAKKILLVSDYGQTRNSFAYVEPREDKAARRTVFQVNETTSV